MKKHDYYTIRDVAREVGVPYYTVYYMVTTAKLLPEPTHKVGELRKLYYSRADLDGFKALFTNYNQQKGN